MHVASTYQTAGILHFNHKTAYHTWKLSLFFGGREFCTPTSPTPRDRATYHIIYVKRAPQT